MNVIDYSSFDDRFYRPINAPVKPVPGRLDAWIQDALINGSPNDTYPRILDSALGYQTNGITALVRRMQAEIRQSVEGLELYGRHVGEQRKLE